MSETKGAGGRRPRRSDSSAGHLERLRANKAKLDADKVEREQREEAALARLAESWSRIEGLEQEREEKIADLMRQIAKVRAESISRIDEVQAGQVESLVDLHAAGRTADEVALLAELPKERVRRILRSATKSSRTSPAKRKAGPDNKTGPDNEDSASNSDPTASPGSSSKVGHGALRKDVNGDPREGSANGQLFAADSERSVPVS